MTTAAIVGQSSFMGVSHDVQARENPMIQQKVWDGRHIVLRMEYPKGYGAWLRLLNSHGLKSILKLPSFRYLTRAICLPSSA
jgi:hypothetical protein